MDNIDSLTISTNNTFSQISSTLSQQFSQSLQMSQYSSKSESDPYQMKKKFQPQDVYQRTKYVLQSYRDKQKLNKNWRALMNESEEKQNKLQKKIRSLNDKIIQNEGNFFSEKQKIIKQKNQIIQKMNKDHRKTVQQKNQMIQKMNGNHKKIVEQKDYIIQKINRSHQQDIKNMADKNLELKIKYEAELQKKEIQHKKMIKALKEFYQEKQKIQEETFKKAQNLRKDRAYFIDEKGNRQFSEKIQAEEKQKLLYSNEKLSNTKLRLEEKNKVLEKDLREISLEANSLRKQVRSQPRYKY